MRATVGTGARGVERDDGTWCKTHPQMASPTTFLQQLAATRLGVGFASALASRARATLHGGHHVPSLGGALLVGNHTFGGVDAFALTALLIVHTGRAPRFLGERNLSRVAMRAGVPIIPVPATGVDELFVVNRREHRIGRCFGGSERYDVPVPENLIPRPVPLGDPPHCSDNGH